MAKRNRGVKARARGALRIWLDRIPEKAELHEIVFTLGNLENQPHHTDRYIAIIGTATLEEIMKRALGFHFSPTISKSEKTTLFTGPEGLFSSFDSRIRIARALGVINDAEKADLNRLKEIRNVFAHSIFDVSFDSPGISDNCSQLSVLSDITSPALKRVLGTARGRFILACAHFYLHFDFYDLDRQV